jgi:hypothetical protein
MAEGAQRERWQHTSCILALIANANRDPKRTRRFTPADFNPFNRRRQGIPITPDNIQMLKKLVRGGRKNEGSD